jgi:hypothetical protein
MWRVAWYYRFWSLKYIWEWRWAELCNALELSMDGTWNYFSKKTKMLMMSKGAERRWHRKIPSYGRF